MICIWLIPLAMCETGCLTQQYKGLACIEQYPLLPFYF